MCFCSTQRRCVEGQVITEEPGYRVADPNINKPATMSSTGLSACYSLIKYTLFVFNFIFWVLGAVILGVGIYIRADQSFGRLMAHNVPYMYTGPYLLIFIGIIIVITGFLGCYGAIRESQCMLFCFFLVLFLIFILLMAAGIWSVASRDKLKGLALKMLSDGVENYYKRNDAKELMDYIQENLECCGAVQGYLDYYENKKDSGVPISCGENIQVSRSRSGCQDKLIAFVKGNLYTISGIGIGVAFIMILGMILSMMLCCLIRDVR